MNEVVVGLGSNIDPEENIAKARETLRRSFSVIGESKFIRTKPVGLQDQPDFINGTFLLNTPMDRETFDQRLKELEGELGRIPSTVKFGPRSIDLDIVVWNRTIIDKDFYDRDFLKDSVLELIPDMLKQKV